MNGIIRVFPRRTSYTPTDSYAFVGDPPGLLIPEHNAVHISCAFSWDTEECERLKYQWEAFTKAPVLLGGPAYHSEVKGFDPGMYIRYGITFTSRGCIHHCPWCGVHDMEGDLVELPVSPGWCIQDNNFLATSSRHKEKVYEMLKHQKHIAFRGGLEAALVDDNFCSSIQNLRISELWLACDTDAALPAFHTAVEKLHKAGFKRDKISCYSLIGRNMEEEEARNREIFAAGAMPFSQLRREFERQKTPYSKEWNAFERSWQRPAIIKSRMKELGYE